MKLGVVEEVASHFQTAASQIGMQYEVNLCRKYDVKNPCQLVTLFTDSLNGLAKVFKLITQQPAPNDDIFREMYRCWYKANFLGKLVTGKANFQKIVQPQTGDAESEKDQRRTEQQSAEGDLAEGGMTNLTNKIRRLQLQLTHANEQIEQTTATGQVKQRIIEKLRREAQVASSYKNEIHMLNDKLQKFRIMQENQQGRFSHLNDESAIQKQRILQLEDAIRERQQAVSDLKSKNGDFQSQIESLRQVLKQKKLQRQEEVKASKGDIESQHIADLMRQLESKTHECNVLKTRFEEEVRRRMIQQRHTEQEVTSVNRLLEQQLKKAEQEHQIREEQYQNKLHSLTAELLMAGDRLGECKQQISHLGFERTDLTRRILELTADVERKRQAGISSVGPPYCVQKEELHKLKEDLEQAKETLFLETKRFTEHINDLEEELTMLRKLVQNKQAQLEDSEVEAIRERQAYEKTIEFLRNKMSDLQVSLHNYTRDEQ